MGKFWAVVIILAMVWALAQADKDSWFDNPVDKIPVDVVPR